ncbi:MAG: tRNA uridine-5-carboxymethylaminomethyl(34) synthesis GTPase MnmE [Nitrospirae bacterium]|nr:MAG: tRNA uridine-5-carboxymethylaminomethyl(34) synthesis GTPase MnmE [Nitrospirota bacterium]
MNDADDTICAIATPVGEGGVGIIRLSGKQALNIAATLVRPRNQRSLFSLESHKLYLSDIFTHELPASSIGSEPTSELLDQALVVVMRGPRSYTGEDVVEIHAHGGPFLLQKICEALIQHGARLAQPGEFTKRAFLNGRLDLVQAEAVLDTIRATTSASLKSAQRQLQGELSRTITGLRETLLQLLAHLEAGLDFVEEDIQFVEPQTLEQTLTHVCQTLHTLLGTFMHGRILREGAHVAIIGRPNVGKSSLLNALVRKDRVIVSPVPGTTRDVIEELLSVDGLPIRLHDTAGLHGTEDMLEVEGIRRTRDVIAQSDLLLLLLDGSTPLTEDDRTLVKDCVGNRCLIVVNKCDLFPALTPSEMTALLESIFQQQEATSLSSARYPAVLWISAKTGQGLDVLQKAIKETLIGSLPEVGQSVVVTHLRHYEALQRAAASVEQALKTLHGGLAPECLAIDIRLSLDALGEIVGIVTHEDVLDRIFQQFCIGK